VPDRTFERQIRHPAERRESAGFEDTPSGSLGGGSQKLRLPDTGLTEYENRTIDGEVFGDHLEFRVATDEHGAS
jgi:hypothetical protein